MRMQQKQAQGRALILLTIRFYYYQVNEYLLEISLENEYLVALNIAHEFANGAIATNP